MVNPICEVKDGSGAYASTANGVNVTPTDAITIRLADGNVDQWEITCITTDDQNVAATINAGLVVDPLNKTATFTAPAAGAALRFRSRVNGGLGPNRAVKPSYTTTFCIYTLTSNSTRTIAADETTEGSPSGWVANVNNLIRTGGGGGGSVADDIAKHAGGNIDRVRGLRGIPISGSDGAVPPVGGTQVYNAVGGGSYKQKKPVMPGHFDVEDYGAIADGTLSGGTDNLAAFNAVMAAISATDSSEGATVIFHGSYYLSDTLHITRAICLKGINSSFNTHNPASQLIFPKGCDGIRVHAGSTDVGPTSTGSAAFCQLRDFAITCKDYPGFVGPYNGVAPTSEPATLYLRDFRSAPWAGVPTAGTSATHTFVTAAHDPTSGPAFRDYGDTAGSGTTGAVPYPKTAQFDGTQYIVGDGSTKLNTLITASAYAFQFVADFSARSAAAAAVHDDAAILTDSSGDCIFVTYTSSGVRAGHKDSGGIKMTPYVALPLNTPSLIQVQYDGTHIEIRVNSVDSSSTVAAGSVVGTLSGLTPRIGANYNGAHGIVGRIGQVVVWDTAPGWTRLNELQIRAQIAQGYGSGRGHGIRTSTRCYIENIIEEGFGESGLAVFADSDPTIYGNADLMVVNRCQFADNGGHGIHCWGGDSQAGSFSDCDVSVNQGYGVYDESLSGNMYLACHSEGSNGHQEDDIIRHDYCNPNGNSSRFYGCYTESAVNLFMGTAEVTGLCAQPAAVDARSTGFTQYAGVANAAPIRYFTKRGAKTVGSQMGGDPATTQMVAFRWESYDNVDSIDDYSAIEYDNSNSCWRLINNGVYRQVMRFPTRHCFWRQPAPWFSNGLFFGDTEDVQLHFMAGTAHSTTQNVGLTASYEVGDTVWQSSPVAGGPLGERCLTAGTCGTLTGITGSISNGGYALTVNDYTGLEIGQRITIAGVTGTKKIVDQPGGPGTLVFTLNLASDATVSAHAVAYVAPTFETFGGSTAPPSVTPGAMAIDWSTSNTFAKTLAAGANTFTFSNATNGQCISIAVTGAASTLTWPTVKWPGGTPPTQTASGIDVYTFTKIGATIYGAVVQAMA